MELIRAGQIRPGDVIDQGAGSRYRGARVTVDTVERHVSPFSGQVSYSFGVRHMSGDTTRLNGAPQGMLYWVERV